MRQDERAPFVQALQRARVAAYAPGEYVEQESFMRAGEIRALAVRAGIAPGRLRARPVLRRRRAGPVHHAGAGLQLPRASTPARAPSRSRASAPATSPAASRWREVPPLPPGTFDVVLLLETMLAFPDKEPLLREIAAALAPGGRFAFTLEEGVPLTEAERARMPDADTVWLTPLEEMLALLERAGLVGPLAGRLQRVAPAMADALTDAFAADAAAIAAQIGHRGAGRAAGRPPALERLAAGRARAQARVRGGEGGRLARGL